MVSGHYWRTHWDEDRILWMYLDRKDAAVNTINAAVLLEFSALLTIIQNLKIQPVAVVIASGKKNGFIAGADVSQFATVTDEQAAFDLIREAQKTFDQLARLSAPTIAMISGFCLGGGCELALACTYRIAENIPATRIGLPEVKLGIHPGWGGTVRLPALVGGPTALRLMLTGEIIVASKAAKIGLIDAAVSPAALVRAVRHYALHTPLRARTHFFSNRPIIRFIIGQWIGYTLSRRVRDDHYPAPFAMVDHWIKTGIGPRAMVAEAKSIAKLVVSATSRHLVRVFFLQNRLKAGAKCGDLKIKRVHVIGAGTMGGDIAAWCAYKGFYVTLQDQNVERIAPAIKRAIAWYEKKLRHPRLVQAIMDRLQPDVKGVGVAKADLVIEAISENLLLKQQLYQKIEPQLQAHAILATNTSSIPLSTLSTVLINPDRLVGIHFFNPVAKMELVEVVYDEKTQPEVIQQAAAFVGQISRLPICVKAKPGFLVNRLLMPYLLEAMMIYEEGISAEAIDQIACDFGMPMGPMRLADTVGLDVCLSVARVLTQYYGGTVPPMLERLVEAGQLGRKSGHGFYNYVHPKKHRVSCSKKIDLSADIQDRIIFRLINEAFRCLEEKIVEDADLLDAAMIFGTGFAPFRGGPMRYVQERGQENVLKRFEALAQKYGDRFVPAIQKFA